MHTEITDTTKLNGWVLYDAECRFCVRWAARFRAGLARRQFELVPLQTPWVRARLRLPEADLLAEMRLLKPDGRTVGGLDALLEIGRHFWWAWPLRLAGRIPVARKLFRTGYRWVARHRHCAGGACAVNAKAEARNPKSDRNPKPEIRTSGSIRNFKASFPSWRKVHFGFRRSGFLRISGIRISDFAPLLVLPSLALLGQSHLAPWGFMWAMAFALYAGCKWLTYRLTLRIHEGKPGSTTFRQAAVLQLPDTRACFQIAQRGRPRPQQCAYDQQLPAITSGLASEELLRPGRARSERNLKTRHGDSGLGFRIRSGYVLAWPGMNAAEFFSQQHKPVRPRNREWIFAVAKTIFGAFLLWAIARLALPAHPLLAGWIGMIGAIFVLHFGLFHLLSLAWRQAGINATPLMQNPMLANSLADFWGARWNTAFNELAFRFTFRPLCRWTTPAAAMLGVFGLSGLIHELVISLPAHGGYGLPTLYFAVQGLGVAIERSRLGRKIGLGHGAYQSAGGSPASPRQQNHGFSGIRGRLFALLITAGPVAILFHPPFIHHVILPMLTAIGAT